MTAKQTVFEFTYGPGQDDKWVITDNDMWTVAGEEHLPISRGQLALTQQSESGSLDIELDATAEIVQFMLQGKLGRGVKVVLKERMTDPDNPGFSDRYVENTIFTGRVTGLSGGSGQPAVLTCENAATFASRNGLRRRMQPVCPWVLYGLRCGVNRDDYRRTEYARAVDGTALTLSPNWQGTITRDKYRNGYCEWSHNETGVTEVRTIRNVVGDVLQLDSKVRGLTGRIPEDRDFIDYHLDLENPPDGVTDAQIYNHIDANLSSNMDVNPILNNTDVGWDMITNENLRFSISTGPSDNNTRSYLHAEMSSPNPDTSITDTYFEIDGGTADNEAVVNWLNNGYLRKLVMAVNMMGTGFSSSSGSDHGLYMVSAAARPSWADNPTAANLTGIRNALNRRAGWPYDSDVAAGDAARDYAGVSFNYTYAGGWRTVEWSIPEDHHWVAVFGDVVGGSFRSDIDITEITLQSKERIRGDSVKIWPGCNHERTDCNDVFSNISNFGGQPNIPLKNPFVELLPFKQGA